MRHVMRDRTTFLIAHRISSVKKADVVIVLEAGRVTQIGTHEELMRQPGHYREIAAAQLQGDDGQDEENPSHMKRMRDELHVAGVAVAAVREEEEKV
jgi:ABC-type protease/lipase transport system fused ATPase/permease subunit